jgi:hypothetical protein
VRLTPDVERTMRRYVLGDLEEIVRSELEELLITDPDTFEALGIVEDELVEEYLEETGSPAERRSFERGFLSSPEGQRRLLFARALRSRASMPALRLDPVPATSRIDRPQAWGWRPAWVGLAATLAISVVGNVWQATRHPTQEATAQGPAPFPPSSVTPVAEVNIEARELKASLAREQRERALAEARAQTLEKQLQGSRAPMVAFTLAAGLLRGAGSVLRVTVPKDVVVVQLRLELPGDDYPLYRAALLDANGDEIWAASRIRAEGAPGSPVAVVWLPSVLLSRGDYQIKLSGVSAGGEREALGTYPFRVSVP